MKKFPCFILILLFSTILSGCSDDKPLHGIYSGQTEGNDFVIGFLDKQPKEAILLIHTPGLLSNKEVVVRLPVTYKDNQAILEIDFFSYRYQISKDRGFLTCTGACRRYPKEFSLQKVDDNKKVEIMYAEMAEAVSKN